MARSKNPFSGNRLGLSRRKAGSGAVTGGLRRAWRILAPAGRGALLFAVAAWLLGVRLGWQELFLVAACCGIALLIAVGFVVGRPSLDTSGERAQPRVGVGVPATGRVVAVNRSRTRLRALSVEVPVGVGRATFQFP